MPPDARGNERIMHFTMKAARSAPPIAHPNAHNSPYQCRPSKPGTPLSSPKTIVHSVGQVHPPKISPCSVSRPSSASITVTHDVGSSSPSYFGLVVEQPSDPRDSSSGPRDNWAPSSSAVKAYSTALPNKMSIPLDANPAYDAFRLQAEANQSGRMFALGVSQLGRLKSKTPPVITAPASEASAEDAKLTGPATETSLSTSPMQIDTESNAFTVSASAPVRVTTDAPAESGQDQDHDSSSAPVFFPGLTRYKSPASMDTSEEPSSSLSPIEDRHPRLSMTMGRPSFLMRAGACARADTVPAKLEDGPSMMDGAQLKDILENRCSEKPASLLLLDLRVSTHFAASRIRGALNLCIPTTLLKRATFNLQKMQLTFTRPQDQEKFAAWKDTRFLVVYDTSSSEKRDATSAMNMLRKFTTAGYKGQACVLRGGFRAFEAAFSELVDRSPLTATSAGCPALSLGGMAGKRSLTVAPIIGGVMLPTASANPIPFFSNIRQNMDLADGVGRLRVSLPANLDTACLPQWLREAADANDQGRRVSERFLRIELAEQARMKHAYSSFNSSACGPCAPGKVQLSGIEKGIKNRYKDILPFEHARVRLHGRPEGACDYVNASHIQASRSLKRYIASQGPLPATFEDFWSVVWDEDVRVIVMLTAESEGGQLKCHSYWTEREYGPIKLRLINERKVSLDGEKYRPHAKTGMPGSTNNMPGEESATAESGRRRATTLASMEGNVDAAFGGASRMGGPLSGTPGTTSEVPFAIIRKFSLTHSKRPFQPMREVTQLHYPSWPDFGTPAEPRHLLAVVELANAMQSAAGVVSMKDMPTMVSPSQLQRTTSTGDMGKVDYLLRPTLIDEPELNTDARPMLVHCSAGCGRTGTFCTVDAVIDMLKRQRYKAAKWSSLAGPEKGPSKATKATKGPTKGPTKGATTEMESSLQSDFGWLGNDSVDLVAKTVEDFRTQRLSMVQSLRQFVLCYETVAEWVARTQDRGPGRVRSESVQVQNLG